ncbi:hypothetical protein [Albidovulum aquaemixtae]|nr:hypothetical protein [Defluviimonas aquaemixtae]
MTTARTEVYSEAPVFVTGKGWMFGSTVTTLPKGTAIRVCDEKKIGVLFDKRTWFWIEYALGAEEGNGWIFSGRTDLSHLTAPAARKVAASVGFYLIPAAHAQGVDDGMPGETGTSNLTATIVYSLAFLAIILGMVAKTVYDMLGDGRSFVLSDVLRNLVRSFVVAPITYLAFLQFGQFSVVSDANVIVGICFAFQNGFFWQTVLERPSPAAAAAV